MGIADAIMSLSGDRFNSKSEKKRWKVYRLKGGGPTVAVTDPRRAAPDSRFVVRLEDPTFHYDSGPGTMGSPYFPVKLVDDLGRLELVAQDSSGKKLTGVVKYRYYVPRGFLDVDVNAVGTKFIPKGSKFIDHTGTNETADDETYLRMNIEIGFKNCDQFLNYNLLRFQLLAPNGQVHLEVDGPDLLLVPKDGPDRPATIYTSVTSHGQYTYRVYFEGDVAAEGHLNL